MLFPERSYIYSCFMKSSRLTKPTLSISSHLSCRIFPRKDTEPLAFTWRKTLLDKSACQTGHRSRYALCGSSFPLPADSIRMDDSQTVFRLEELRSYCTLTGISYRWKDVSFLQIKMSLVFGGELPKRWINRKCSIYINSDDTAYLKLNQSNIVVLGIYYYLSFVIH